MEKGVSESHAGGVVVSIDYKVGTGTSVACHPMRDIQTVVAGVGYNGVTKPRR